MNRRIALQRLWWKELRQLAPMVALLPMLVVLLLGFHWLTGVGSTPTRFHSASLMLCLGMPALFACGAGAMLVGYEKELRTLGWLTSMPIASHRIVRVKLLAALVGLVVLWLLGLTILAVVLGSSRRVVTQHLPAEWTWISNSLFVLMAGFALAWRVRSALVALLLVVPVAVVPYVMAQVIDEWVWGTASPSPPRFTVLACQLIGVAIAWWLTERYGRQALAPQPTGPASSSRVSAFDGRRTARWQIADRQVQSRVPALVWQFARQSRPVLWGTAAMLAAAMALLATATFGESQGGRIPLGLLLAFLATAWLGTTTFQSDAVSGRIRFLSDRGVSPGSVWLTRQAVPVSLLALSALVLVIVVIVASGEGFQALGGISLTLGLYSLLAVTIYLASQWLAQVIFSPIVAAIAAPLVALAAIAYENFAIEMLGTPLWLALLVLMIPMIATRTMTRRWMDRRLGMSYWASHGGFLAVVCLVPAAPVLLVVAREPAMPRAVAVELQEILRRSEVQQVGTVELVLHPQDGPEQRSWPIDDGIDRVFAHIEEQLQATNQPIGTSSQRVLEFLRSTATLSRLKLTPPTARDSEPPASSLDPDNVASEEQESLQHYRRAVRLLVEITQRMRLSPQLIDQDTADVIEIWLLSELQRDQVRERFGQTLYEETVRMLKDRSARSEARERAIALSWQQFQSRIRENWSASLGGYTPQSLQEDAGTFQGALVTERRVGMAVADLWDLARGGPDAATPEQFRRIAAFWGHPVGKYGLGPQGPYLRADDLDRFIHPPFHAYQRAVASQWNADWERLAAELSPE